MTEGIVLLSLVENKKLIKFLPFIIVFVTAWFSEGYLHPDEHYQILEYLKLKTDTWTIASIFNWDFKENIRPWTQIFVYYILNLLIPFKSPFLIAWSIRLLNGLIGIYSFKKILSLTNTTEETDKKLLYLSIIWFVPLILVRTNSESLSTSLFFIGSYFFLKNNGTKNSIFSAILFGLSFLCRFQMGVVVFAVNIVKLYKTKDIRKFLLHSFFICLTIILGAIIDFWGYEIWSFSPYNYLYQNIIIGRSSEFGTEPFWYYITASLGKGIFPISIIIFLGACYYIKGKVLNHWSIAFLSFLIIHSLIPHKELRFLNFNFLLAAYMTVEIISFKKILALSNTSKRILKFIIVINFLILAKVMFTPVKSNIDFYEYVYNSKIKAFNTPTTDDGDYFKFTMPFYQHSTIESRPFELKNNNKVSGLILTTKLNEKRILETRSDCHINYSSYPSWIERFNYFNWLKRSAYYVIWSCR
jgi:phosphatidylinositol glycan class B